MDLFGYIITTIILGLLFLLLLYFVIKSAVRNALIDDRAFQTKVEKMRADARNAPSQPAKG